VLFNEEINHTQVADILIVDDQSENLAALEAIIDSPELNIVRATSGPEALSFLLNNDYALIFLDVQMPGMDGFETAKFIKSNKKSKHIPIIFVTSISKKILNRYLEELAIKKEEEKEILGLFLS